MRCAFAILLVGCSQPAEAPDQPDDAAVDTQVDVDRPPPLDKSAGCVNNFGNSLTDSFGRLDGTIVAVLAPGNTTCPKPNSTHLIIEVRQNGEVYRMVASMKSTVGNPVMAMLERDAALVGPAWQEGWHTGVSFDFVTDMNVHRNDFAPTEMPDLVYAITDRLNPGARVSVYGTSEDAPDSAHLIHRNFGGHDGAIVIDPDTAPHYMMMRFDNQLF